MRVLMLLEAADSELPERLAGEGYEVIAVDGPASAASVLAQEPVDAVIVDTGAGGGSIDLLRRVEHESPQVLRIARCRLDDAPAVTAAIDVAHQVLARPCTSHALARAIEDAALIRRILGDERLDEIVGGAERLPQPPRATFEIYRLAAEGDLDGICALVEQDPSLTARVLRAVNTPYFGLPRTVSTVRDAALFLGADYLVALVVGEGVGATLDTAAARAGKLLGEVQERGRHAAGYVRVLGERTGAPRSLVGAAFTAAILRDVGVLALAMSDVGGIDHSARALHDLLQQRQIPGLDATVGQVGAYLLGLWNLPDVVVAGVAGHEQPPPVLPDDEAGPTDLVYLGARLADEGERVLEDEQLRVFLACLGLTEIVRDILTDSNA